MLVQGKRIHSGKLYPFKETHLFKEHIYSLKIKAICSYKETIYHRTLLRSRK